MLAAGVVVAVGMFGAPAPARAGGTQIVVATPGVLVAIGGRDHRTYYRDYGHKDYDYGYRDYGHRDYGRRSYYRDYDRYRYKDRGYHRGYYRSDYCDHRGRRYRY